ncbi:MAG: PTS lactose/cellobiose transporter subunit IIA [Clostridium sp.]|nr:PTS lactose/cellobiose transporter subunit IIA [Clostridium sp.]
MEEKIMLLIVHSGEARSCAMEAITAAKQGKMEEAEKLIAKANAELSEAHNTQTALIQAEAGGEKVPMSLLMVHAQDHFMTSMTVKDLAVELIEVYKRL